MDESPDHLQRTLELAEPGKLLFLPLYTRSHWIASVVRVGPHGRPILTYYDSAPSHQVRRDIDRVFARTLKVTVNEEKIQRQERDSMDCGLYMFAVYAGLFFERPISSLKSKVRALRDLLSEFVLCPYSKPDFLDDVREVLYPTTIEGGSQGLTHQEMVPQYLEWYQKHLKRFARNCRMRSLFVTIALVAIAEGKLRLVEWTNLASQASKRKIPHASIHDVADLLNLYGYHPNPFGKPSREKDPEVVGTIAPGPLFLQKGAEPSIQLPERVGHRVFVVGACYVNDHYELCTDPSRCLVGVYVNDFNSADALNNEATPQTEEVRVDTTATCAAPLDDPEPLQENRATATSSVREDDLRLDPQGIQDTNESGDDDEVTDPSDNAGTYLAKTDTTPKNRSGGQLDGQGRTKWGSVCPRLWILNPQQHPLFFNPKESGEHALRLSWLRRFQKLPSEYLSYPVDEVVIDMLKKDAVARSYTWATFVRKLLLIQSALINLPLYSNQECGIDLKTYPRWVETVKFSKWMQQRSDAKETAVISVSQFQDLHRRIRHTMPLTALYLRLMWCTAGRPGDVEKLKIRDVFFRSRSTPTDTDPSTRVIRTMARTAPNMVPISVTMKRGKGAYFRGTYIIHTAIPREDADQLAKLVTHRRTSQLLFAKPKERREQALWALKQIDERAIVPSIRKSALCFLAEQGLTEEELMAISGHTRVETLHRYLGVGRHPTRGDVGLQARAAAALRHLQRPSS